MLEGEPNGKALFELIWWRSFCINSPKLLKWFCEKASEWILGECVHGFYKKDSPTSSSSESAGSTWTRAALKKTISRKLKRKTYFSHFDLKSGKQTENAELHYRSLYFSEVSSYCCWRSIPAILCVPFSLAFGLSICLKVMILV